MYSTRRHSALALSAAIAACAPAGADGPAAPAVVEVTATDYAYRAPDTVHSGLVTIRLRNDGREIHHGQLVRLDSGRTVGDLLALHGHAFPGWVRSVGGPGVAAPGDSTDVTLVLGPGRYALICFIPSPDGVLHVAKGMLHQLEVLPGDLPATPARADLVMVLDDYRFELSGALRAGRQTLEVTNVAPQPHEVVLVKLEPGRTAGEFLEWFFSGAQGPTRGRWIGGVVGLDRGERNWLPLTLERGTYALLCFLPDAGDGRMHLEHGMLREIVVN